MKKTRLLMTNDDGPKSPLVAPFIASVAKLPECSELRFVFPAEEQSWISQAVSRFRPIYTSALRVGEHSGFVATGSPADCVGLGLHHLYPDAAEIVLSGINVGTNASLPFYFNSGTVGGARQAVAFGVRAIALSVLVPEDLFRAWREEDFAAVNAHGADWARIAGVCAMLTGRLAAEEFWDGVDCYTINVPWLVEEKTPIALTELERASYLPLYTPGEKGSFTHHFQGFRRGPAKSPDSWPDDLKTLEAGKISVTPICYDLRPREAATVAKLRQALGNPASRHFPGSGRSKK